MGDKIFKSWNSVKIPYLENLIKTKYKVKIRTDNKVEKFKLSNEIANTRLLNLPSVIDTKTTLFKKHNADN